LSYVDRGFLTKRIHLAASRKWMNTERFSCWVHPRARAVVKPNVEVTLW